MSALSAGASAARLHLCGVRLSVAALRAASRRVRLPGRFVSLLELPGPLRGRAIRSCAARDCVTGHQYVYSRSGKGRPGQRHQPGSTGFPAFVATCYDRPPHRVLATPAARSQRGKTLSAPCFLCSSGCFCLPWEASSFIFVQEATTPTPQFGEPPRECSPEFKQQTGG